jgi:hypothetical protein
MQIIKHFVSGLISVLKVTGAPLLYRYPYRTSSEGLRSDWLNIGNDIESVMGKIEADSHDGR